jgi:hypothetical protein
MVAPSIRRIVFTVAESPWRRPKGAAKWKRVMFPRYDASFFGGAVHGEGEVETEIGGVVERRCEESARVCEESTVGDSGGEEVEAVAGRRGAEGDETQDSVSIGEEEGGYRSCLIVEYEAS